MMVEGRIVIIPFLQGTVNFDGTVTEPDIEKIFEKWLERHPEFQGSERDYKIIRALSNFEDGIDVGLVRVTAAVSPDLESYDPAEDADLYEEFLHESDGLYVTIWQKTALVPWTEFKGVGEATLYWQKVPMLTIGNPPVATMTLPVAVFQMMRERLPTALTGA